MPHALARVVPAALVAASSLSLALPAEAAARASQGYYWMWSDGSRSLSRTFAESRYGTPANLPHLVVTAQPASPGRWVSLEFRVGDAWSTESRVRTDPSGVAEIDVNPFCTDDSWCDETIAYRLRAGGQTARLTVTYTRS